jgi:dihydrofolate synthase/folylpolyglutamate synthase
MPHRDPVLEYLFSLQRHGIRPGLGRVERLLKALGKPHLGYPCIHVCGTNGKGSTSAFLASMLSAAGYRCALYTSPHLTRFNERIRVNKRLITDAEAVDAARAVKEAWGAGRGTTTEEPTFFEFTTAMAFLHFSRKKADIAVIETGMGGRLDATNVVAPLVSVITNVGLDHTEHLGHTIREIAREKAGIIKAGVPTVTAEEGAEALEEIARTARDSHARLFRLNRDFSVKAVPGGRGALQRFDYLGINGRGHKGLAIKLRGPHQLRNAACALASIEVIRGLGFLVPEYAMRRGLERAEWPGRVEVARRRPLVILDAAHNPDGARSLADALRGLNYSRLVLVIGILADKDISGIFEPLAPMADAVILAMPRSERAASLELMKMRLRPYGVDAATAPSVEDACRMALALASPDDAVCVTGSIYTVGEARARLVATPGKNGAKMKNR